MVAHLNAAAQRRLIEYAKRLNKPGSGGSTQMRTLDDGRAPRAAYCTVMSRRTHKRLDSTRRSSAVMHPFEYQLQQAFQEDFLDGAAQQRLAAKAKRAVVEPRRPVQVLRAVAACLRWFAVQPQLRRSTSH